MTKTNSRASIETVIAWLDAMRREDLDAALGYFAPDVVWEGLVDGVECSNRDDVREMLREGIDEDMDVVALEIVAEGNRAVLGVRSPKLRELAGVELGGQLFNAFTIEEGQIVRVHDYASRAEAHEAAGFGAGPKL
jgi:ketosteroid isomerase-like protein